MGFVATKFELGQKAFLIRQDQKQVRVGCGFCLEGGWVVGANLERRLCPECRGQKYHMEYLDSAWCVVGEFTLGLVQLRVFDPELCPNQRGESHEESYMALETGVGSGSVYYAKDLFPTEQEARAECMKRNTELEREKREAEYAARIAAEDGEEEETEEGSEGAWQR